jgi:F-type H+-transporting ATPase subunit b
MVIPSPAGSPPFLTTMSESFLFTTLLADANPLITFRVNWPTLVAQAINFLILAALLYFFAFKKILSTLDERQKTIASGLKYAEDMKLKLAETEKEREAILREASLQSQRIMKDAQDQTKVYLEQQTQAANQKAEDIIRRANEAGERERQQILNEVRAEIGRLVVTTSTAVLNRSLSAEEKKSYSDAAVREIAGSN